MHMKLSTIFHRFKGKISVTFFLVILEAFSILFFPLFIGWAINDLLEKKLEGIYYLAGLGAFSLLVGGIRRFYDSRAYAKIFEVLGAESVNSHSTQTSSESSARLNMLKELIEFFEDSFPALINNLIGLVGTLFIVFILDQKIFWGGIIILGLIFIVYYLTSEKTLRYNKEYNNEMEKQVDIITNKDKHLLKKHISGLMRANIKLSDLETINFSVIWLIMIALLIYSIVSSIDGGIIEYGVIFSLIMYVFQFIESSMSLPLYYQQWLRLVDISERLKHIPEKVAE